MPPASLRVDVPIVGTLTLPIAQVWFNCIRVTEAAEPADGVHLRQSSLHRKVTPWAQGGLWTVRKLPCAYIEQCTLAWNFGSSPLEFAELPPAAGRPGARWLCLNVTSDALA